MGRVDARCRREIPVVLETNGDGYGAFETRTVNIGLGGAFLNSEVRLPEETVVTLRALLPEGHLEVKSRVVRTEADGMAVRFMGLPDGHREGLWGLMKNDLENEPDCPYCGAEKVAGLGECLACGLSVDFSNERYLDKHKQKLFEKCLGILREETAKLNGTLGDIEREYDDSRANAMLEEATRAIHDAFKVCGIINKILGDYPELLSRAQAEFRQMTHGFFSKSYFMNHARTWPKGHPGDYKILENIYRNAPMSEGIGRILDMYFLSTTLAVAVRHRLSFVRQFLSDEMASREGLRILNIACGSCRELFELSSSVERSGAAVTCVDFDPDALDFALNRFSYTHIEDHFAMRKYNALRMVSPERNLKEFGPQDVVYSIGLFDYLDDGLLVRMFSALYKCLNPGGKMLLSFKDKDRYETYDYHWLVDWSAFLQRPEGHSRRLVAAAGIPGDEIEVKRDGSGVIIFYLVSKR